MHHEDASFIAPVLPSRSLRIPRLPICPRCSLDPRQHQPPSPSRRHFLASFLNATLLVTGATQTRADDIQSITANSAPSLSSAASPTLSVTPTLKRGKRPTWSYSSNTGPSLWHSLSPDWRLAQSGKLQSPIALSYKSAFTEVSTSPTRPRLQTNSAKMVVRLRPLPNAAQPSLLLEPFIPPPPSIVGDAPPMDIYTPPLAPAIVFVNDTAYALKGIHFHANSTEHEIDGWSGILETHFCFERSDRLAVTKEEDGSPSTGNANAIKDDMQLKSSQSDQKKTEKDRNAPKFLNLAVLAQKSDSSTPWLSSVLNNAPLRNSEERPLVISLEMSDVIPDFATTDIYLYSGSFSTPPCMEDVQWLVLSRRMSVSETDVSSILRLQGEANVRPLQDANDRPIVRYPAIEKQ